MRKKIYKILRIKVTTLVVVVVLFFIALQTPWLKRVIAHHLITRLSTITQSEIQVRAYEGFVPLNFDFYDLSFKQKGEKWLHIERLSLNRTLIRFFFWKNRGIDVSLIHPKLIAKPNFIQNSEPGFTWPSLPFQKLSIRLNAYQIEISPSLTPRPLPVFNAFNDLHIRKSGSILELASQLNSPQFPKSRLNLQLKGSEKKQEASVLLKAQNLNSEISRYFFKQKIPDFNGKIELKGDPNALLAFFHPKRKNEGFFEGDLEGTFSPSDQDSEFFSEFLDEENLRIDSKYQFEGTQGLQFYDLKIKASHLLFQGEGFLTRDYQFKETLLQGRIHKLQFLSPWIKETLKGKIELNCQVSGPFEHPKVEARFSSREIQTEFLVGEQLKGDLSVQKEQGVYEGTFSFSGKLNHIASSCQTQFSILDFSSFSLKDFELRYGENTLMAQHFKSLEKGQLFQGDLEYRFGNLSHLSPFIKNAIQGNATGLLRLETRDLSSNKRQSIELTVQGEHFEHASLELNDYYFRAEGKVDLHELYQFDGTLFFKNQNLQWKHYHLENLQLTLNPKNGVSPFELETTGEVQITSSGQISKSNQNFNLLVRQLRGQIFNQSYSLERAIALEFSPTEVIFSPLDMKIGPGSLFLSLDSGADSLRLLLEKFPVEVVTLFVPKFDLKGYVDLNGSFSNLFEQMEGKLSGSVYQFAIEDYHNMAPFKGIIDCTLDRDYLRSKLSFYERKRDRATIELKIPVALNFYPMKAHVDLKRDAYLDLHYKGIINPFIQILLPQNHLLEGYTEIDLQLEGPLEHPHLKGFATLEKGYYENLFLGLVLKNINSSLKADKDHLKLESFTSNDDLEGEITAEGEVHVDFSKQMPFDLNVDLNKGRVIQFDFLEATFTGGIQLKGDLNRAKLKGDLDVLSANVTIPNYIGSNLPKLSVTYLYPKEQKCPNLNKSLSTFIPLDFDLHLDVANKATLKGRGLDTIWEGKVDIKGDDTQPKFEGKLKNIEGTFVFAGKVLKLDEGLIKFDGDLVKKTYINLIGNTQIHNAKIMAYLQGPIMGPKLSFRSDPPHSQTEILSLILFNEYVQKLTPFQAVALTHSLATLSGTYLGPDIIDKVRRGIGVDQLTFGSSLQEGGDYTTIQVGKYITRNVLITLNRPLSVGTSPFVITAHIRGGIELQTYFDENEISKISIQWKLSY